MARVNSVTLNATKVAARAKREEKTATFTAEQRAHTILRNRAAKRPAQSKRALY